MARTKYKEIIVLTPRPKGTVDLRNIITTYVEGLPYIKFSDKYSYRLILAGTAGIRKIITKLWLAGVESTFRVDTYLHYSSDAGYCYFYEQLGHRNIIVKSKNLKVLWD